MLVILHHINLFEEVRLLQRKKDVHLCFDRENYLHTLSIKITFLAMTFLDNREIFKFTVCVLETSYCSLLHYYKREIVTKVGKPKEA